MSGGECVHTIESRHTSRRITPVATAIIKNYYSSSRQHVYQYQRHLLTTNIHHRQYISTWWGVGVQQKQHPPFTTCRCGERGRHARVARRWRYTTIIITDVRITARTRGERQQKTYARQRFMIVDHRSMINTIAHAQRSPIIHHPPSTVTHHQSQQRPFLPPTTIIPRTTTRLHLFHPGGRGREVGVKL